MDLWHRGLEPFANLVLNRYLDERDESGGLPLMPFFMALRAAVRAHVTAAQAAKKEGEERQRLFGRRDRFVRTSSRCRPAIVRPEAPTEKRLRRVSMIEGFA